jgi:transposase
MDVGQQWVIFAALRMLAFIGGIPLLRRLVAWLLAHADMDLGTNVIAAVVGVSDRAIRTTKALKPKKLLHGLQHPVRGHAQPKLRAEDAGVIAQFLVDNRRAYVQDVIEFIEKRLGVTVDRLTLRRYLKRYGLGVLRKEKVDNTPLF